MSYLSVIKSVFFSFVCSNFFPLSNSTWFVINNGNSYFKNQRRHHARSPSQYIIVRIQRVVFTLKHLSCSRKLFDFLYHNSIIMYADHFWKMPDTDNQIIQVSLSCLLCQFLCFFSPNVSLLEFPKHFFFPSCDFSKVFFFLCFYASTVFQRIR